MDQFGAKFSLGAAFLFWSGLLARIFSSRPSFFCWTQESIVGSKRSVPVVFTNVSFPRKNVRLLHSPNSNFCHMLCNLPSPLKIKIIKDYCNPGQLVAASQYGSCPFSSKRKKCLPISLFSNFYFLSRRNMIPVKSQLHKPRYYRSYHHIPRFVVCVETRCMSLITSHDSRRFVSIRLLCAALKALTRHASISKFFTFGRIVNIVKRKILILLSDLLKYNRVYIQILWDE